VKASRVGLDNSGSPGKSPLYKRRITFEMYCQCLVSVCPSICLSHAGIILKCLGYLMLPMVSAYRFVIFGIEQHYLTFAVEDAMAWRWSSVPSSRSHCMWPWLHSYLGDHAFATHQCDQRHYDFGLSVRHICPSIHLFIQSDIITKISHELLEQFW